MGFKWTSRGIVTDKEPGNEFREAATGEDIVAPSSMWTMVQKTIGTGRRRQCTVATYVGKHQPAHGGSRFTEGVQQVAGMVFGRTKTTSATTTTQRGRFGTKIQGTTTSARRKIHQEDYVKNNNNGTLVEEVVRATDSFTKPRSHEQQRDDTRTNSITIYEDVVEVDKNGQVCINTYELPATSNQKGDQSKDSIPLKVNEFSMGHGPRPPDWWDISTNEEEEEDEDICQEQEEKHNQDMEEEDGATSTIHPDSDMEQSTETAAHTI